MALPTSVVLLLLKGCYTTQIVWLGAEFTRLYTDQTRGRVPPEAKRRSRARLSNARVDYRLACAGNIVRA